MIRAYLAGEALTLTPVHFESLQIERQPDDLIRLEAGGFQRTAETNCRGDRDYVLSGSVEGAAMAPTP